MNKVVTIYMELIDQAELEKKGVLHVWDTPHNCYENDLFVIIENKKICMFAEI